ncbi:hypothetical protein J3R82DRAFT_2996 [Butyriboletus roseoflavus]|nr:hypothetical protein J3R82DRAFT_2996 [Butyriboletus roseoflavus]
MTIAQPLPQPKSSLCHEHQLPTLSQPNFNRPHHNAIQLDHVSQGWRIDRFRPRERTCIDPSPSTPPSLQTCANTSRVSVIVAEYSTFVAARWTGTRPVKPGPNENTDSPPPFVTYLRAPKWACWREGMRKEVDVVMK